MHFPIRGLASIRVKELKAVKRAAESTAFDGKLELKIGNARYGKQFAVSATF